MSVRPVRSAGVLAASILSAASLGLGVTSASAIPTAGLNGVKAECATDVHSDSTVAGRSPRAKDPTSLDRPGQAMEAQLTKALAAKGYTRNAAGQAKKPGGGGGSFTPATIDVYWHVITDGTKGKLSASQINGQITVLNNAYAGSGFCFALTGTTTTNNSRWYNGLERLHARRPMKTALRKGDMADLNIYTANLGGEPARLGDLPEEQAYDTMDGVVILDQSLPGRHGRALQPGRHRDARDRPLAEPLPHVPGRLLGLRGRVTDTPAEASAAFGCPTGRDTCTPAGTDPIKNFMDYTDDSCMNTFSAGQATRMQNA